MDINLTKKEEEWELLGLLGKCQWNRTIPDVVVCGKRLKAIQRQVLTVIEI